MNWTLALPEIVLACIGMATLVFGVVRKQDSTLLSIAAYGGGQFTHGFGVEGNVRWAAASIYQGERYLSGEESDIELVAVARRATEMEYEALRLIEVGPR